MSKDKFYFIKFVISLVRIFIVYIWLLNVVKSMQAWYNFSREKGGYDEKNIQKNHINNNSCYYDDVQCRYENSICDNKFY